MMRVACAEPRCPGFAVPGGRGRCARHRRTETQRGYPWREHQDWRARLARTLPAPCWYGCGRTLAVTDDWVAAHLVDGDPHSRRVVSCRTCNERAKGTRVGGMGRDGLSMRPPQTRAPKSTPTTGLIR